MAATLQAGATHPDTFRDLFRHRNYALLWLGQSVSQFGDRLHQVALLVLVGIVTGGSLSQIGLVFVAIGLPELLFGLFAGAFADRFDRRRLMVASDLARVVLVLSLPFLATLGMFWVYAVTFVLTTATIVFRPARDAILPSLVPKKNLLKANSLSNSTESLIDVLGYPVAGAIVVGATALLSERSGITAIFFLDAATYLFSAFMIFRIKAGKNAALEDDPDEEVAEAPATVMRSIVDGMRHMTGNALLLTNALLMSSVMLIALTANVLSFGYAFQVLDAGAFGYGLLEAALGIGALLGGLAVGQWGKHFPQGPLILCGVLVMGASFVPLAFVENLWIAVVCIALVGAGNLMLVIPSATLVQTITADNYLGRVFSVRGVMLSLTLIAATALGGYAAETFGVQVMWGVAGTLLVVLAIAFSLIPSARNLPKPAEE